MTHPTQWPFVVCFSSCPQISAVIQVIQSPEHAAAWRQVRVSQRGDGGGSQSDGDLQGESWVRATPITFPPPAPFFSFWFIYLLHVLDTNGQQCQDGVTVRGEIISNIYFLFQDQLSADMYSFVAKEIDYANYFQTVSIFGKIRVNVVCFNLFSANKIVFSILAQVTVNIVDDLITSLYD